MGDLYRLKDAREATGGNGPIDAERVDQNFRTVRLRVGGPLSDLLKIEETAGQPDTLTLNAVDEVGTYVIGVVGGKIVLLETEDC